MPVPRSITSAEHRDLDLRLVDGEWPDDITGEFVVSSPRVEEGLPYALFGSGVLCRLSLEPGSRGAAPERWAWRTEGHRQPLGAPVRRRPRGVPGRPHGVQSSFGSPNQANTAPLPWGGRLFATWDVGRPVEVDPISLAFLGEVGHQDDWGDPGGPRRRSCPSSCPRPTPSSTPNGTACGRSSSAMDMATMALDPWVVRYDGDGTGVQMWPIDGAGVSGSMHTITQTRELARLRRLGELQGGYGRDDGRAADGHHRRRGQPVPDPQGRTRGAHARDASPARAVQTRSHHRPLLRPVRRPRRQGPRDLRAHGPDGPGVQAPRRRPRRPGPRSIPRWSGCTTWPWPRAR